MHRPRRCYYCGHRLTHKNNSIDHKVPRSRGGRDTKTNKVDACRTCNNNKGSLTLEEWRLVMALRAGWLEEIGFRFHGEEEEDGRDVSVRKNDNGR